MRRTTSALTAAVLGTALSATTLIAQQTPPDSGLGTSTTSIPGMTTSRGARYLLRNGWDYLKYQEYERALNFFREAEQRKAELNPAERQALTQGIDNARRGMREAGDGSAKRAYAGRGPIRRPGAFALAKSPAQDPIQLTSGTGPAPALPAASASPNDLPPLPLGAATPDSSAPASASAAPAAPRAVDSAMTLAQGAPAPLADPAPLAPPSVPAQAAPPASGAPSLTDLPPLDLNSVPLPPLSSNSAEPPPAVSAPTPPTSTPAPEVPATPPPLASEAPAPISEPTSPAPVSELAPPAELPGTAPALPESLPEPPAPRVAALPDPTEPPPSRPVPPASEEPPPPLPAESLGRGADQGQYRAPSSDNFIPERSADAPSTLSPELQREVHRMAQKQEEDLRAKAAPERAIPGGTMTPGEPGGLTSSPGLPSPRLEISRAPSPTEARPIRAIPVPDEFVPLPKREWEPNRKYWSSAAVCHMPLYFQDAVERYGQTVEQAVGPGGRYLSYPVDDPKQSTQRNQLAQPFASIGLFAAQIALLPYNLVMDPPWEAEYDLGYYRPGDRIPPDTYYLPLTGVGPPLHGKRY